MPFVYFETFGCQMNAADSDMLGQALYANGYLPTEDSDAADLIIVNTCSVREHAERRALARIREYCGWKKKRANKLELWIIGCMAQRMGETLRETFPEVDRVIGAKELVSFVGELRNDSPTIHGTSLNNPLENKMSVFVPIMRGCNNYCSYCVVPSVRGEEASIPASNVIDDIHRLIDKGTKEVTLLGQNVNSYHDGIVDFPDLLEKINSLPGLLRIRFTTSHPKDCSDKFIRTMARLPKVCRHLHLPVQSGSTRILREMNRCYDRETYLRRIEAARKAMPGIDITTDAMVGFPSETKQDFEETLSLFREVRFTTAFMFAYSKRENTRAADMIDDVPEEEKKARLATLIDLQTTTTKEHYFETTGKPIDALFIERQRGKRNLWMGRDNGCKRILLSCMENIAGTILKVRAIRSSGMTLIAERI